MDTPKNEVVALFDELAEGYDRAALRFLSFVADRLAERVAPRGEEKVLDVGTGAGAVAVAIGQRLARGRVVGVDFSERMLDKAYANVRRMALHNVDLHPMDGACLEFRAHYFDALTCSLTMFLLPDWIAALKDWRRVLRPGGRIGLTCFGADAFQPLFALYRERVAELTRSTFSSIPFAWQGLADAETTRVLVTEAGFDEVEVVTEQFGYHLQSPEEWWEILWYSEFRAPLLSLNASELEFFRRAHLADVSARFNSGKLWLEMPVHFVSARAPST